MAIARVGEGAIQILVRQAQRRRGMPLALGVEAVAVVGPRKSVLDELLQQTQCDEEREQRRGGLPVSCIRLPR